MKNLLLVNERRGRISPTESDEFLKELEEFQIEPDNAPDGATLMSLARRHRLTAYDAAYLELARRRRAPLAPLDRPLTAAAGIEGVELI